MRFCTSCVPYKALLTADEAVSDGVMCPNSVPYSVNIAQKSALVFLNPPTGDYCSINSGSFKRPNISAFSLIELLVTIAIFAILMMIAIPSFNTEILNSRLNENTDSLISFFNYARNVALNYNSSITVCPVSAANSSSCGTNWNAGWIAITQPTTGTPILLKSQQNATANSTITSTVTSVTFNAHGLTSTQSNFTICDTRGSAFASSVTVMATGFIQSGNIPGQAVWNNTTLVCP